MKTERDFLSRISNEGSYARNGRFCEVIVDLDEATDDVGCKIKSNGVGVYAANCMTEHNHQDRDIPRARVLLTCSWSAICLAVGVGATVYHPINSSDGNTCLSFLERQGGGPDQG